MLLFLPFGLTWLKGYYHVQVCLSPFYHFKVKNSCVFFIKNVNKIAMNIFFKESCKIELLLGYTWGLILSKCHGSVIFDKNIVYIVKSGLFSQKVLS